MTKKTYHWEIHAMEESKPYFVSTERDCVLSAATQFTETWGENISVYSIRKSSETIDYLEVG